MFTARYELNVYCLCTRRCQHKMVILFDAYCVHYLWERSCWGRADILYLVKLRTNIYLGFTLTDTWRMGRYCLQDINHNTHTEYGTLKMRFWFSSCLRKWCDGYCTVRNGGWRGGVFWAHCVVDLGKYGVWVFIFSKFISKFSQSQEKSVTYSRRYVWGL